MAKNPIGWCDTTWNPIIGCSHISPGCDHCYAERMAKRLAGMGVRGYNEAINYAGKWHRRVEFISEEMKKPRHWRKPRRIFVCSMGDLFHENVPFNWQYDVFRAIADCPQHTFMILTKRPEKMPEIMAEINFHLKRNGFEVPLKLAIGVTAENQEMAYKRIPVLLETPAAWRFVSVEPMLEAVVIPDISRLDWVICGGETGPCARPMHTGWVRSLCDQCVEAGVPFWFKQWGDNVLEEAYSEANGSLCARYEMKHNGHILDGREWRETPEGM